MSKRIRRGDPANQRRWEELVQRWEQGGQSVRGFCLAESLRESAFYFWRRRLARQRPPQDRAASMPQPTQSLLRPALRSSRRASAPRSAAAFLPVRVVEDDAAQTHAGSIQIILAAGRSVQVRPGFDRQTLADVLAVLETRPC